MEDPNGEAIGADTRANGSELANAGAAARPKPYLSIRELSALTPWTQQAIRTMMTKGQLKEGEHFFRVGRRTILKWDAIVGFIERGEDEQRPRIPLKRGGFVGGSTKA